MKVWGLGDLDIWFCRRRKKIGEEREVILDIPNLR